MSDDEDDLKAFGLDRQTRTEGFEEFIGKADAAQALDVLGNVLKGSPTFQQFVAKRAAASRPLHHKIPLNKARDWQVDFGPETIAPGQTKTIQSMPRCLFRGDKIRAAADGDQVYVNQIFVGQKPRLPRPLRIEDLDCRSHPLHDGIALPTCDPGLFISFVVENRSSSPRTVDIVVLGKAVL